MPGVNLTFHVTGANVRSATALTNSAGQASFTYTSAAAGSDLVQASAGSGSMSVVSNLLSVSWTLPTGPLPSIQVGAYTFWVLGGIRG
jgi:hypothetical protein